MALLTWTELWQKFRKWRRLRATSFKLCRDCDVPLVGEELRETQGPFGCLCCDCSELLHFRFAAQAKNAREREAANTASRLLNSQALLQNAAPDKNANLGLQQSQNPYSGLGGLEFNRFFGGQ